MQLIIQSNAATNLEHLVAKAKHDTRTNPYGSPPFTKKEVEKILFNLSAFQEEPVSTFFKALHDSMFNPRDTE